MNCPSFDNLIAFVESEASDTVSAAGFVSHEAIAAHLASGCARCAANQAWYAKFKTITASDDTQDAPPWVLRRAVKLFETPVSRRPRFADLGRVIAALVFDSVSRPALTGARSAAASDRQLLYRANDYSIDLQMAAVDESRAALSGQILREGEFKFESVAGLECHLVREGQKILSTMTNRFGEFALAALEHGHYDLQIETDEISITVVGLPVA
ncbi:MAG: hypothetical protein HY231_04135 [Acidobacteria bacterium]|nr:hypothetical protein [Acidobacteriota bacterium]